LTPVPHAPVDLKRYRPNVGIVLINPAGKVWLGRRADARGPTNWQFPQGGLDPGETPMAGALRELREETGAQSVSLLGQTHDWIAYAFPRGHRRRPTGPHWIGQKQLWFAFRFTGDDAEFDLAAHHEVEFDAWKWADLDSVLESVVPFKRETYRAVIEAFEGLV